jgi:HK97 family phage prohead protease
MTRDAEFLTREADDGARYIEGYFAVYGGTYQLWDDVSETIDPGAFDLAADRDVRALTNHDTTLVLGRTMAGTLELRTDERGLWGSVKINEKDQDAVNLYERVKRGDVTQCSFGFDILTEQMENRTDGSTVFHLQKVKLYEVSVCTFPAYEETGVQARKKELDDMKKRKHEAWAAEMRARLKGEKKE